MVYVPFTNANFFNDMFFLQMMLQLVHSSWILHVSCNKRRVAPIAALLSSILHYSVFNDLNMHWTIDGEKGPLKWVSDLLPLLLYFIKKVTPF